MEEVTTQRLPHQTGSFRGDYVQPHRKTQSSWRAQPTQSVDNDQHQLYKSEVIQMFEKSFQYKQQPENGKWQLPPPKELFSEFYQFNTLQQLKQTLNAVKCKLNDYELESWSLHTRRQDPSNEVPWRLKHDTKAEFVTVAWCKFYECLQAYPLVKGAQLNSLHLCELPGAFIAALNHYLHSTYNNKEIRWNWLSTTLNPYYEGNPMSGMISDDRLLFYTFDNWLMHNDFTGNIINRHNIEEIKQQCVARLQDNVQLITADGSIDCVDAPDCQEEVVSTLHFAEITTALSILADGGCFVLKMFTLFESINVCKLYLLNCCFEELHVFKPATSKRGNSEVYIVCIGYKKQTPHLAETLQLMKEKVESSNVLPLFAKAHLPKDFLVQHEICSRMFMNLQINAIEANIYTYEIKPTGFEVRRKRVLRNEIANEFYQRYKVQCIPQEQTLLYGKAPTTHEQCKSAPFRKGSYSAREMAREETFAEKIFALQHKVNELEKSLGSYFGTLYDEECAQTQESALEMRIYRGSPYAVLQSSVFVNPLVMQLNYKLLEATGRDPLCQLVQSCNVDGRQIVLDEAITNNYSCAQREFYTNILNAIVEGQSQQLTFTNVAFLTHYAVSILYFLSTNVFERTIILAEPTFQVALRTQETKYKESKLEMLKKLQNLLENDSDVLCIVPIEQLQRNEFSNALMEYNKQLLLHNFKLTLQN